MNMRASKGPRESRRLGVQGQSRGRDSVLGSRLGARWTVEQAAVHLFPPPPLASWPVGAREMPASSARKGPHRADRLLVNGMHAGSITGSAYQ